MLKELTGGSIDIDYALGTEVLGVATASNNYVYFKDGHGSNRQLVTGGGSGIDGNSQTTARQQQYDYDAYGEALGWDLDDPDETIRPTTDMLYAGEQWDADLGMQYLRARYYLPGQGVFNRVDPFFGNQDDPQSLHKYAYVHGDPVNGTDPRGLFTIQGLMATMGLSMSLLGFAFTTLTGDPVRGVIAGAMFGAGISMALNKPLALIHGVISLGAEYAIHLVANILDPRHDPSEPRGLPSGNEVYADLLYAFTQGVYDSAVFQLVEYFKIPTGVQLLLDFVSVIIDQIAAGRDYAENMAAQLISAVVQFFLAIITSNALGIWPRAVGSRLDQLGRDLLANPQNVDRFVDLAEPAITQVFTQFVDLIVHRGFGIFDR